MAKQAHSNGVPAMGAGQATEPTPTPLSEWQRLRMVGTVKTLSTGRVIRWRPVELIRALQQGKIPDNLTGFVAARVWTGNAGDTRSNAEKAVDWMNYLDLIARLALMEPEPQLLLATGDLLYDELIEIEETVTSPAKALQPFPGKQGTGVDAGAEGGQVQPATQ